MIALIVDLLAYLKAVFIETWQKIFTFFDILGIVLFFYPQIAADLVNDLTFVRIIGLLIFFRIISITRGISQFGHKRLHYGYDA
jgi:hypothetical protein